MCGSYVELAQADQGLCCPLTEWIDTVVYVNVDKHRVSKSDCMGAHAHLDIHCFHMASGPFSHVAIFTTILYSALQHVRLPKLDLF